jgi:hypothetical protein
MVMRMIIVGIDADDVDHGTIIGFISFSNMTSCLHVIGKFQFAGITQRWNQVAYGAGVLAAEAATCSAFD